MENITKIPGYSSWFAMKRRVKIYPKYIKLGMCDRWKSSRNFLEDMGPKPSPSHILDRIDGSRGYYPGNCRWATYSESNFNRRTWTQSEQAKQNIRIGIIKWHKIRHAQQTL